MGRLISKIASTQCGAKTCDFSGDVAFLASDDWKAPCPKCGETMNCGQQPKFNQTHIGNRRFSGDQQISIAQGFHPKEVPAVRRLMGASADCIQDDGRVRFKDSRSEQRFRKDLARAKAAIGVPEDSLSARVDRTPDHDARAREAIG